MIDKALLRGIFNAKYPPPLEGIFMLLIDNAPSAGPAPREGESYGSGR